MDTTKLTKILAIASAICFGIIALIAMFTDYACSQFVLVITALSNVCWCLTYMLTISKDDKK